MHDLNFNLSITSRKYNVCITFTKSKKVESIEYDLNKNQIADA